jgi:Zn-dependent protease with chaperone function
VAAGGPGQLVLGILAGVIVLWFSRRREFRAEEPQQVN